MSRRKLPPIAGLREYLIVYCKDNELDFHQFTEHHMRISNGGLVEMDCWVNGRFWVMLADFGDSDKARTGEKGRLPTEPISKVGGFLDKLFFADGEVADE